MARFISSGKFKRVQIGSDKTYRGWTIQVFLKIELDKFVLNTNSHFQAELEKGNIVHGFHLDRGQRLLDAYNLIFQKIDELVEEEKKRA